MDEAGLSADMVHPNKVRYFARAHGFEAKTDGLDARVLSLFGEMFTHHLVERLRAHPSRERGIAALNLLSAMIDPGGGFAGRVE